MNNILIVGNGFDLDLGLNTSFHEFYNSKHWICEHEDKTFFSKMKQTSKYKSLYNEMDTSSLFNMLDANPVDEWNELETIIEDFAQKCEASNDANVATNLYQLKTLCEKTKDFVEEALNTGKLNEKSAAARLLNAIYDTNDSLIYNFNFTNIEDIARSLNIKGNAKVHNVHGSVNDNNVIIGASNTASLSEEYDVFKKMFAKGYRSSNISHELMRANNIIFFGHSLTKNDSVYFKDYFDHLLNREELPLDLKQITIVTFDETSRHNMIRRLEELTNNRTYRFFQENIVRIFTTKDLDEKAYMEFLDDIV